MITPAQDVSVFVVDITIGPNFSTVSSSRKINTVNPLSGGGDLSADRTLSLVMSPQSGVAVGSDRVIAATTPVLVNGAPFTSLNNDVTVSMNAFDGNNAGYVVPNPSGIQGKYYQDNGTWNTSTVSGVPANRTLTMVPPLKIDGLAAADLSVNRTIDGNIFTASVKGFVPASGGDPTKFLCADASFKVPTALNAVTLRPAGIPAASDSGSAAVSSMLSAANIINYIDPSATRPSPPTPLHIAVDGTNLSPYSTATLQQYDTLGSNKRGASLDFRMSRGTPAVPTQVIANDFLGSLSAAGYTPDGNWGSTTGVDRVFLYSQVTGLPVSSSVHAATVVKSLPGVGGDASVGSCLRITDNGVQAQLGSGLSGTAVSVLETTGTFGMLLKSLTSGTAYLIVDTDPSVFLIDCTFGTTVVTLPDSTTCTGRIYKFTKVDETAFRPATIIGFSGQSINASAQWMLYAKGESISVISDGANWWIIGSHVFPDQSVQAADYATVANTVAETQATSWTTWNTTIAPGAVFRAFASGKLSTNGNPTLRFRVRTTGNTTIADSGAIETPGTVTDTPWQLVFTSYASQNSPVQGRIIQASVKIAAADGVFTEYSMWTTFGNPTNGPVPTDITVQWGTASASNTLTCTAAQVAVTPRSAVF